MTLFNVVVDGAAPEWAQRLGVDLNSILARIAAASGVAGGTYQSPYTGGVSQTLQSRGERLLFVSDFMDMNSRVAGTTDDAPAFQSAASAADAGGGGTVLVDASLGPFRFASSASGSAGFAVICHKGTKFVASTLTDDTSNTNGSGAGTPTISATGTVTTALFKWVSATAGNHLYGGGIEGFELLGNQTCAYGVIFDNCIRARARGNRGRQFLVNAIHICSDNGVAGNFSMRCEVNGFDYVYGAGGAADPCKSSNAVFLGGNGSGTVLGTQHIIRDVRSLLEDGFSVEVRQTDNCLIENINGNAGGSGGAVWLRNVVAPANSNWLRKITGKIQEDAGLCGNTFRDTISEGGGLVSGSGKWSGDVHDYNTGEEFVTHRFPFVKKISLPAACFIGASTSALFGTQWGGLVMPNSATAAGTAIVPDDYDLSTGNIVGVEILVGSNGTSAGAYRLTLTLSTFADDDWPAVITPDLTVSQTFTAGSQYFPKRYSFSFTAVPFTKGQHIAIKILRSPADAADTNTDDMIFLGARIVFNSSGPPTPGSGTYTTPTW